MSCSFIGPSEDVPEANLPDFDVVRLLNGFRLEDLQTTVVSIDGTDVVVATPAQLLDMKRKTVEMLSRGAEPSPRLQDYLDIQTLSALEEGRRDGDRDDNHGDR